MQGDVSQGGAVAGRIGDGAVVQSRPMVRAKQDYLVKLPFFQDQGGMGRGGT